MKDRKIENTNNDDINIQADALTDLPVSAEQAEQAKGGAEETKARPVGSQVTFTYMVTNPGN